MARGGAGWSVQRRKVAGADESGLFARGAPRMNAHSRCCPVRLTRELPDIPCSPSA